MKDQPDLIKRMAAEGHLIGNHSWSHPYMTQIPKEQIGTELGKVKTEVLRITGESQTDMTFMRQPRGIFNERVLAVSKEQGYINVFWSAAYKDWDVKDQKGWKYDYDKIMAQLHPEVILIHSVSFDNEDALGPIIDSVRKQGYEFKRLANWTPDPSEEMGIQKRVPQSASFRKEAQKTIIRFNL